MCEASDAINAMAAGCHGVRPFQFIAMGPNTLNGLSGALHQLVNISCSGPNPGTKFGRDKATLWSALQMARH